MKRKFLVFGIATVVGLVIIAGITVALYLSNLNRPGEATARYLPIGTEAYVSINLRPGFGQLNRARQVFSKLESEDIRSRFDDAVDDWKVETGIDVEEDVWSWIGADVTFAVLDDDPDGWEWIAMVQTNDRSSTLDFVEDLSDYIEEQFDIEFVADDSYEYEMLVDVDDDLAVAVTGDYLMIGDSSDTVEDIAENLQLPPSRSLADNEEFTTARERLPDQRFMFAFAKTENALDSYLDGIYPNEGYEFERRQIEQYVPEYAFASMSFMDAGVRLDLAYPTPPSQLTLDEADPIKSPDVVPADTLVLLSYTGIVQSWNAFLDVLQSYPEDYQSFVDALVDIEREFNFDLESDVIDSLSGEFAFALLPSDVNSDLFTGNFQTGGAIEILSVMGTRDAGAIEAVVDKYFDWARENNVGSVRAKAPIGEIDAVSIRFEDDSVEAAGYSPTYLLAEDWIAAGTTLRSVTKFHDTFSGNSPALASSDEFQRVESLMTDPLHYLIYANISELDEFIEDALPVESRMTYRRDYQPFIDNLSTFAILGSITEESTRLTAVLTLRE